MSHLKERQEKICLNCNAELNGRYCHTCGQENIEPKDTVWSFITHFFYDVTHFDGKFFYTVGKLFRRPGFLSKEYISGKRSGYLHPIRMYIFSSAIFFLFFFSMVDSTELKFNSPSTDPKKVAEKLDSAQVDIKKQMLKSASTKEDSLFIEKNFKQLKKFTPVIEPDSVIRGSGNGVKFSFTKNKYSTRDQYDSAQKKLPERDRDNWLKRKLQYRGIELSNKYKDNDKQFFDDLREKFIHTFPYILFVSLPLYALFLRLLYIRRRKKFFFVDHGLFLIHLYVFTFLFLLVFFALSQFKNAVEWDWLGFLELAMMIYGVYYAYKAMKNFYGQGTGKTILKFLLFNFLCFVSIIILFAFFFVITVYRV